MRLIADVVCLGAVALIFLLVAMADRLNAYAHKRWPYHRVVWWIDRHHEGLGSLIILSAIPIAIAVVIGIDRWVFPDFLDAIPDD